MQACVRPTKINEWRGRRRKERERHSQGRGSAWVEPQQVALLNLKSMLLIAPSMLCLFPVYVCLLLFLLSLILTPHFALPHTCHHLSVSKIWLPQTLIDYFMGFLFELCCNFVQIYNETKANHCRTR